MSTEQAVITDRAALNFLHLELGCNFISFRTSDTATRYVRYHIVSNEDLVLSEVAAREHARCSGGSKHNYILPFRQLGRAFRSHINPSVAIPKCLNMQ